ncbi:MAG: Anaerobic sulfite reductase subunit B [Acidimicrobiales bacterium]|nr:Anaerobic sulfite reductase subunit B [Acidimicrobiales bacterium]
MVPTRYRVATKRQELTDTWTLGLEPVDEPLEPWSPGQFNMLWAFGVGEVAISISGSEDDTLLHTVRRVGAGTEAVCALAEGEMLGLRGPFGSRWRTVEARGKDVVILAGGIGLAPLRPAIRQLLLDRGSYGRISILVGARHPEDLLFVEEMSRWAESPGVDVEITVDTASSGWSGHVGVVTSLMDRVEIDGSSVHGFACGPEVMMRFAAKALTDRGVAPTAIDVSLERNMKCAIAQCGHCQLGPTFVCRDGPVLDYATAQPLMMVRER